MKFKKIFLVLLLPLFFTPLISSAQFTTPGCYTTTNGILVRLGDTTNGTCAQGSPLGSSGSPGVTVSNNLPYTPLEPIPGQATGSNATFCSLLNTLFTVLIYLGGMLAVLFLVLGGITYMVSEVVDKRSMARDRIKGALLGLLLLLMSWIILNTVNPQLIGACNMVTPTQTGVYYPPTATDPLSQKIKDCEQSAGIGRVSQAQIIPETSSTQDACAGKSYCSLGSCTTCSVLVAPSANTRGAICITLQSSSL
jgi:hypothetical protein